MIVLSRRRPRIAAWSSAVVGASLALGVAACGPTQPTESASPQTAPATAVPTAPAPSSASPSRPLPPTSLEIPPSLPPGVSVDPGLLEVLPLAVDGVALEADPDTAAEIASDPLLADSALSVAVALAATGTSASDDLAVASVIRLRPDLFDEAFYQEWRDTYNEAACEIADGVEFETPTEIGGHAAYVGTCSGGAQTYHTYLEDQGFIVSVSATGERRLGEQILAGIAR